MLTTITLPLSFAHDDCLGLVDKRLAAPASEPLSSASAHGKIGDLPGKVYPTSRSHEGSKRSVSPKVWKSLRDRSVRESSGRFSIVPRSESCRGRMENLRQRNALDGKPDAVSAVVFGVGAAPSTEKDQQQQALGPLRRESPSKTLSRELEQERKARRAPMQRTVSRARSFEVVSPKRDDAAGDAVRTDTTLKRAKKWSARKQRSPKRSGNGAGRPQKTLSRSISPCWRPSRNPQRTDARKVNKETRKRSCSLGEEKPNLGSTGLLYRRKTQSINGSHHVNQQKFFGGSSEGTRDALRTNAHKATVSKKDALDAMLLQNSTFSNGERRLAYDEAGATLDQLIRPMFLIGTPRSRKFDGIMKEKNGRSVVGGRR